MCGLSFSIYPVTSSVSSSDVEKLPLDPIELFDSLAAANFARGPDTQSTYTTRWTVPGGEVELKLNASVLGLRGGVVAQPLTGERGVLGWNGQVNRPSRDLHSDDILISRCLMGLILAWKTTIHSVSSPNWNEELIRSNF